MTEALPIRVAEFYSGIGGARTGVEKWAAESNTEIVVVASYDMNDQANRVYESVFKHKVRSKGIEHLKIEEIKKCKADMWLLSPPCQPFTLGGGRRSATGDSDNRCKSFTHIVKILSDLSEESQPRWIIIENVSQFAESETVLAFKNVLVAAHYNHKEVITSPISVGIPYQRKRYYLLCSKTSEIEDFSNFLSRTRPDLSKPPSLSSFLKSRQVDIEIGHKDEKLLVPESIFNDHKTFMFDVVSGNSTSCSCFTKGYSKNYKGSGSLLLLPNPTSSLKRSKPDEESMWISGAEIISSGALIRYFSPDELLALHGFHDLFRFPEGMTNIQKYRLIGNSLSCDVHQMLTKCLIEGKE